MNMRRLCGATDLQIYRFFSQIYNHLRNSTDLSILPPTLVPPATTSTKPHHCRLICTKRLVTHPHWRRALRRQISLLKSAEIYCYFSSDGCDPLVVGHSLFFLIIVGLQSLSLYCSPETAIHAKRARLWRHSRRRSRPNCARNKLPSASSFASRIAPPGRSFNPPRYARPNTSFDTDPRFEDLRPPIAKAGVLPMADYLVNPT